MRRGMRDHNFRIVFVFLSKVHTKLLFPCSKPNSCFSLVKHVTTKCFHAQHTPITDYALLIRFRATFSSVSWICGVAWWVVARVAFIIADKASARGEEVRSCRCCERQSSRLRYNSLCTKSMSRIRNRRNRKQGRNVVHVPSVKKRSDPAGPADPGSGLYVRLYCMHPTTVDSGESVDDSRSDLEIEKCSKG